MGKRAILAALAVAIGGLAAVLLGEGALRVLRLQGDTFYRPDPYVGWVHASDKQGWYVSPQVKNFVSINEHGHVGPPRPLQKPPGRRRVLLLGDSFTASLQVPYEVSWAHRVEEGLGPSWEALNAGVAGYGTCNALLYLRQYGWQHQPDALFLLFFTGNDVSDNDWRLREAIGGAQPQPWFVMKDAEPDGILDGTGDRELELVEFPVQTATAPARGGLRPWLRRHSLMYRFLRDRWFRMKNLRRQKEKTASGIPLTWQVYRAQTDADWERAWQTTEGLLELLHDEAQARGVPLVVGILPTGWRIDPAGRREIARQHPEILEGSAWDVEGPDRRLQGFLRRRGIAHVNLTPALRAAAREDDPLYLDHLTPRGHQVVADEIVAALEDVLGGR